MKTVRALQQKIFDRVNPAVRFSVTRYVMAIGFFVGVVVFGIISVRSLGVDLLPAVNIPVVVVDTQFPGATPGVVDDQVTHTVENAVSTLSGITDLSSSSSTGSSRVRISFDPNSDRSADANQVAALVSGLLRRLPAGVSAPVVRTFDPNSRPIIQFGLRAEKASLEAVGDYVDNTLTPLLQRVDGVANITVDGAPSRQFQVLLDPSKLDYYKILPQNVVSAISSSAVNLPIGVIVSNKNTVTFATRNMPEDLNSIRTVLVDPGRGITVGTIASVRDVPAPSNFTRVNGKPVVLVSLQKSTESNAVQVVQDVRELLHKTKLPTGYVVEISNDTTGPIQASILATYNELFLTAVVVAIILLLFLGKLNTALSVIFAIPIALSAAPILYNLAGFSFNLVSLLALIVAIGIVVDDSIVVAENVERYRAMGYSMKESVLKGASEVFSAVVAASLSLLSVLLPVSFLGGFIGRYIMQFSLGLSAAVFFSLLEAVLFLTVRMAYTPESKTFDWRDFLESFIRIPQAFLWGFTRWKTGWGFLIGLIAAVFVGFFVGWPWALGILFYPVELALVFYAGRIVLTFLQALTTTLHHPTEAFVEWVRDHYANILNGIIKQGPLIMIGSALLFGFTVVYLFFLNPISFNLVPQSDGGTLQVNLRLPTGTPSEVTNVGTGRIEAWLLKQKEVYTTQTTVGGSSQDNQSSVVVQLVPIEQRSNVFDLIPKYRGALTGLVKDLPSARVSVSAGGGFQGQGSGVSFVITAANFDVLQSANQKIIDYLNRDKWVVDVNSSLSNTTLENDFIPNPYQLKGTGITPSLVANALQTYASGTQAANVEIGGVSYPIIVQIDPIFLSGTQSLLNLPVFSSTLNTTLQVGQLGHFELTQAPVSLTRYNRLYSASLDINLKPGAPTALAFQKEITEGMTKEGILDQGVDLGSNSRFGPAALAAQLSFQGPIAFLMALFLAYLVMGAQFNSWKYPIYLLLPVPLALVGALWFIFFTGGVLDIFGLLGMLMLIGLSAKNAILYLDFVVERLGKMPFKEALVESARLRFRPIVMTTLTVLVISFPLIFSGGQGSEFGQKMGVVMLGGILSSAVLTFFVVPAAFYLFEKRRHPDSQIQSPVLVEESGEGEWVQMREPN